MVRRSLSKISSANRPKNRILSVLAPFLYSGRRRVGRLMGTNSLYGLLSASQGQSRPYFLRSPEKKGFRSYFQGTSSAARGLVKCRDLQLSPSFASSSSHSGLPLSDILQLLLPFLCIGCGIFLASLPELNQIPVPEFISNPIWFPLWYRCRRIPQCCYRHS